MKDRIEFDPETAARYFFGYAIDNPAEILDAYRTLARGWHECNVAIKENSKDRFRVKQIRKGRAKIQNDMLQLKVAIQLLVDAGFLGRERQGPYCEARRFILETWVDSRKKSYQEFMKKCDDENERLCKMLGAANIIHREGAPALMVINGKSSIVDF